MNDAGNRVSQTAQAEVGDPPPLGSDLLRGADQIAEFILGDPAERRKIYHLAETSKLPVFRLGSLLCARRSTLLAWIKDQESSAVGN